MASPEPSKATLVTMSDIARMAGVSESTVSRALSGSPLVAEKTRMRIAELARSTKYAVNQQARNLAVGQTKTIEVIFPIEPGTLQHVSDPFFVDMLATLTDVLAEYGYDALLTKSTPWEADRPGCAFQGGRADGVIFVGQGKHRSAIRDFARAHSRVVTWGAVDDTNDSCIIGSDNVLGGYMATRHMLSLGRRRIAFLGDCSLAEIAQRHEGYARAIREAGGEVDDTLFIGVPFDIEQARSASAPLTELFPAFDGIFAASDMIAIAALANLRGAGIAVPDDVSVVGFDDVAMSAHIHPSLTTMHQSIRQGGRKMIEKMMQALAGETPSAEMIAPTLVVRESCGSKH